MSITACNNKMKAAVKKYNSYNFIYTPNYLCVFIALFLFIKVTNCLATEQRSAVNIQETQKFQPNAFQAEPLVDISDPEVIELPALYSMPVLNKSEYQEMVPGILTSHEYGPGTAGHLYLRGKFLHFGSGLYTSLDGMPLSMRQNAMGNGYTDLNVIIPELIDQIDYREGSYAIDHTTSSPAGVVNYKIVDSLDKSLLKLAVGQDYFFRMVAATSENWLGGKFLYAADIQGFDNAWDNPDEDEERLTSYFKQIWEEGSEQYGFTFVGMRNNWNSPTPIPSRAVNNNSVGELDTINASDRGKSRLAGITGFWQDRNIDRKKYINTYFYSGEVKLFTDNTYGLYDSIQGDQFLQVDLRNVYGVDSEYAMRNVVGDYPLQSSVGLQIQNDMIRNAGLFHTINGEVINKIVQDEITIRSLGLYIKNGIKISPDLTAALNLRHDFYLFDTSSSTIGNTNSVTDHRSSENITFDYRIHNNLSTYASVGKSYNTNSVQDINNTVNPLTSVTVERKSPFIDITEAEIGFKYQANNFVFTITGWKQESDAEIVYSPATNTSTSTRPSERKGVETQTLYRYNSYTSLDFRLTVSSANYTNVDYSSTSIGTKIVGAPDLLAGFSVNYMPHAGYYTILNAKYIGKRPLNESGSLESEAIPLVNLRVGKRWKDFSLHMDFLNLFNSDAKEVSYLYTSQLSTETIGVEDTHYRVLSPFTYRLFITHDFK